MNDQTAENLASFLSYLQKRMDFIAQVATSAPSWCMVTNSVELIDHFNNQFCLTRNIIRSHQGIKGGPNFEPLLEKRYNTPGGIAPDFDIPHGQVGLQAFYTILENIVRNTAKYGDSERLDQIKNRKKKPGDGKLRFTIAVADNWEGGDPSWTEDFYQIRITDHLKCEGSPSAREGVVPTLNNHLAEPLTNPATGVVNPKNWGMKEIKICAAYLRMIKQDAIDSEFERWDNGLGKRPPVLKVSLENIDRQPGQTSGNITYTLYLLRPKRALMITEVPDDVKDRFRRAGIDFWTEDEFKLRIEQGERPRHSFLGVPKPEDATGWNWLSRNLNFLPPRVIVFDGDELDTQLGGQLNRSLAFMNTPEITTPPLLMDTLMENWTSRWWNDFQIVVRWSQHSSTVADVPLSEKSKEWTPEELRQARNWVVFDHLANADEGTLYSLAAYHDILESNSPMAQLLKRKVAAKENEEETTIKLQEKQSKFRIKEMAGLSVAVIDERVWLEKDGIALKGVSKYREAKTRMTIWAKRRVYIQDTNKALDNFKQFVEDLNPPDRGVFDFIIIHQGIIDGVKDKLSSTEFQDVWLNGLRAKARWLVVDSGRGQPEQARVGNLRWVEYSNLAECLIQEAGNKFKLNELLWTLRASSKSEV